MSLLEIAVGWLAPPLCVGCGREGSTICLACMSSEIIPHGEHCFGCNAISPGDRTCEHCRRLGGPRHVWICTDYEGLAKEAVHKYKFGQQRIASKSLAQMMADTFLSFNSDAAIEQLNYLIVPVPTATARVRQRGFDHSVLLAQRLAQILDLQVQQQLIRLGQTRQLGAPRTERMRQLDGSFKVRNPEAAAGRNLLLVDDVLTTGGTLCSAAKTLRKAGARRIDAVVFAKRL
jgi:ComF family protein